LRIIASIAHKGERPEQLKKTIASLENQCDELYIYDNSQRENFTDNAKFFHLSELSEPCYYFSADDDIIYPPDYVQHTVELIYKYGIIMTYHGRLLKKPINSYYKGHQVFDFRGEQPLDLFVDVAGTGVCAFRTDYFNPTEIYKSEYKCMSDLVFSLEAKKQNKKIICASHSQNWITQQEVTGGILQSFANGKQEQQIELAKLICE
jgi:hypothetical protein